MVKLRPEDIDEERMLVHIKEIKGEEGQVYIAFSVHSEDLKGIYGTPKACEVAFPRFGQGKTSYGEDGAENI